MSDHYDRYNGMEELLGTNLASLGTDAISRQAAIDVMAELQGRASTKAELKGISKAWKRIKELPPIQPEIIRCKDCKHHWTHKCMDSMPIERCDLEQTFYDAEIDFCSLAERREVTE